MQRSAKAETLGNLRRGSACLSCRRRKLKCDGTRPVCNPCDKMKRASECQYDDSKRKSRTQVLRERLQTLTEKVRELEAEARARDSSSSSTSSSSPSVFGLDFDDPGAPLSESSSQTGSPTWLVADDPHSTLPFNQTRAPISGFPSTSGSQAGSNHSPGSSHYNCVPVGMDAHIGTLENPHQSLPQEILSMLLQTFTAHQKQCFFYSDIRRFSTPSFLNPPPHPSLINAIYLLGCHFSESSNCSKLEPLFLKQALHEIVRSLSGPKPHIDVIQASCLLAQYYYFNGRKIEGYRHSFSAMRMAIGLGLHQIRPPETTAVHMQGSDTSGYSRSSLCNSAEVAGNSMAVFWQVFVVDRLWSAANDLVAALPDDKSHCHLITTPLPTLDGSPPYEILPNVSPPTFSDLFTKDIPLGPLSPAAFKIMTAALIERTSRIHCSTTKDGTTWANHRSADMALQRITAVLPPFLGRELWRTEAPFVDMDMFAIHTMIRVSTIHLQPDRSISRKVSWAANGIIDLVSQLHPADYPFIDPIIAICWSCVCRTFIQLLKGTQGTTLSGEPLFTVGYIHRCVEILLAALQNLVTHLPLASEISQTIQQEHVEASAYLEFQ